jgi:hypothetical protein
MLAPGLVPAVCSSHSVIGGRETLFDEDVLHHQRDRRCRPGSWSNSMHSAARMLATYPGRTEGSTEGEPMSRLIGYSALLAAATLLIIDIVIG